MGKQTRSSDPATISLAKIVIEAHPDKVYKKLAEARKWEGWLTAAKLIHTARDGEMVPGQTFCYTSPLAPGFTDAVVEDAEPSKVFSWGDKALFGLVKGESRWQLKEQHRVGFMARRRTLVILDQEVTGPLGWMVGEKRLDSQSNQWLKDLKDACEAK